MTACLAEVGLFVDPQGESGGVGPAAAEVRRQEKIIERERLLSVSTGAPLLAAIAAVEQAFGEARVANWDGYGARPASAAAAWLTIRLLTHIPLSIQMPETRIDSDGDVILEWYREPRCVVTVAVNDRGEQNYAALSGADEVHGKQAYLADGLPLAVKPILQRYFARPD